MSANECLLDFPHTPVWCDYHYKEQMEGQVLIELRRSNDLKQREIELSVLNTERRPLFSERQLPLLMERQLPFKINPVAKESGATATTSQRTTAEEMRQGLSCGAFGCPCNKGGVTTHCPAHEDAHPSLTITDGNGTPLWKCHTGCTQEAVREALVQRGLWGYRPTTQAPRTYNSNHTGGMNLESPRAT